MTASGQDPVLVCRELAFRRPEGFSLGPLDLEVRSGEIVALLGPNGAGKSTLLELTSGVLRPAAGGVELFGRNPARAGRRWVARRVAVLPQQLAFPFALSVEEVVSQGRWPHLGGLRLLGEGDRRVVDDALRRARVEDLRHRDVRSLSGGERQRVLLAKALAQEPQLLLLDEPSANLDPGHVQAVLGPLLGAVGAGTAEEGQEGLSLLLATHDVNLAAAVAHRVVLLRGGTLVDQGPPSILTEERLRETYEADLRVEPDPATGRPRVWLHLSPS